MSDILIRGMEMPKNCLDCFACHVLIDKWLYCEPLDTDVEPGSFGRLVNCPLAPVPPHGRLIDADEFLKRAIGTKCFRGDYALMLEELVGESTTIIPASDKDINVLCKKEGET